MKKIAYILSLLFLMSTSLAYAKESPIQSPKKNTDQKSDIASIADIFKWIPKNFNLELGTTFSYLKQEYWSMARIEPFINIQLKRFKEYISLYFIFAFETSKEILLSPTSNSETL